MEFTTGPLIHTGELYDLVNTFEEDLPFYARHCKGRTLELCCGTGRLTIPLARRGVEITGVDLTPAMLERARVKARSEGLHIPLHQGDMRSFDLGERFDTVFIPFNSLQCLYTLADIEATVGRVRAHLSSGGRFLLDVFNPSLELMVNRSEGWHPVTRFEHEGRAVSIEEQCAYDDVHQVNRVIWRYHFGDEVVDEPLDMRCFYPEELLALLGHNGFEVLDRFGDFQERPFARRSPKMIFVCRMKQVR